MKNPEVKEAALAKQSKLVFQAEVVYVKVAQKRHIEQLFHTRGELLDELDPLKDGELVVGALVNGTGILIRDITGNLRLIWPHRYLLNFGLSVGMDEERAAVIKALPQIFEA